MKKLIYFLVGLSGILYSCSNQSEDGIEQLITENVQSSLPSGWTYEPIAFSITDSAMSRIEDTQQYKELLERQAQMDSVFGGSEAIENEIEHVKTQFHPQYIGQNILHAYLCSTPLGDSLFIEKFTINGNEILAREKGSSIYIESPDSVRMESTKKQLKQFLDEAVKWK